MCFTLKDTEKDVVLFGKDKKARVGHETWISPDEYAIFCDPWRNSHTMKMCCRFFKITAGPPQSLPLFAPLLISIFVPKRFDLLPNEFKRRLVKSGL